MHARTPAAGLEFLQGGGKTGALIRSFDWAGTPLGSVTGWPQSLKTTVGLLLRSPVPMVLLWGPDGVMIYNDAYAGFAGGRHPHLLGSKVLEGWPEVRDFNANVMQIVMAGGTLSYRDQELTLNRKGTPKQVWMNLDYSPVLDESGRPGGVLAIVVETTTRVLSEATLRESETRLRGVLDGMAEGFALLDPDFRIIDMNAEAMRYEARPREEVIGKTHWEAHPHANPKLGELYRHGMANRVPVSLEHRYVWPNGRVSWFSMHAYPVGDGLAVFYGDITKRVEAEKHRELLINELNHRVKNTLATVQSIAAQSLRTSAVEAEVRNRIDARLIALSDAHNLLTEHNWEGTTLNRVVGMALRPHRSDREERFEVHGPEVHLSPKTALAIAMALHELATNAIKYGALSNEAGQVSLRWEVENSQSEQRLHVVWSETGGPPVTSPSRKGFGTRLIERGLAAELGGSVELAYPASGVVCTIDTPLPTVTVRED